MRNNTLRTLFWTFSLLIACQNISILNHKRSRFWTSSPLKSLITGDTRRLELPCFLKVKSWSQIFFYITISKFILNLSNCNLSKFLISRSKIWVPLHIFYCFSLLITWSCGCVHTHPTKHIISSTWTLSGWL